MLFRSLRIGRLLAARMNEADFTGSIFTVVNQLNLGGGLILDREERERVAAHLKAVQARNDSAIFEILSRQFRRRT